GAILLAGSISDIDTCRPWPRSMNATNARNEHLDQSSIRSRSNDSALWLCRSRFAALACDFVPPASPSSLSSVAWGLVGGTDPLRGSIPANEPSRSRGFFQAIFCHVVNAMERGLRLPHGGYPPGRSWPDAAPKDQP